MWRLIKQTWIWGATLAVVMSGGLVFAQSTPADPGACTEVQHRALQDAVDAACKIPRRCSGLQSCSELDSNYAKNIACADARDAINLTCYGGGDSGHRQAADDARRAAQRCAMLRAAK